WISGMAAYGVYYVIHAHAALAHIAPGSMAVIPSLWIKFGGVPFLLTTSRMGLLLGLPMRAVAVYLPLALLGVFGWRGPLGTRLIATVGSYVLLFSVAGTPANFYWGGVYSPLLAYGAACSFPACRDLVAVLSGCASSPARQFGQ